jgi:hypothetical protein
MPHRLPKIVFTHRQGLLYVAMTAMVMVQLGVVGLLIALWFEAPWLSYENLPFPVLNEHALHVGDEIPLEVTRCNRSGESRSYLITRTFVNAQQPDDVVMLQSTTLPIRAGCTTNTSRANKVPEGTKPGFYRIVGKAQVDSTLRTRWIDWSSMPFEVVAPVAAVAPAAAVAP